MSAAFTHSQLSTFGDCPRRCYHSYEERLAPLSEATPLYAGTLIHTGVEHLRRGAAVEAACEAVRAKAGDTAPMSDQRDALIVALECVAAYAARWPEPLKYLSVEEEFEIRFTAGIPLCGKVDGVEDREDGLWIHETKSSSRVDGTYIDRLWIDSQIHTYARAIALKHGRPVRGSVYDVAGKPSLRRGHGESEEEFQARYAALAAKNKNGKSTATRRLDEFDEEFSGRVREWYAAADRFLRVEVPLAPSTVTEAINEAKCAAREIIAARKRTAKFGVAAWRKNTKRCFDYFRACPFLVLCKAHGGDDTLKANLYRVREDAHPELSKREED